MKNISDFWRHKTYYLVEVFDRFMTFQAYMRANEFKEPDLNNGLRSLISHSNLIYIIPPANSVTVKEWIIKYERRLDILFSMPWSKFPINCNYDTQFSLLIIFLTMHTRAAKRLSTERMDSVIRVQMHVIRRYAPASCINTRPFTHTDLRIKYRWRMVAFKFIRQRV